MIATYMFLIASALAREAPVSPLPSRARDTQVLSEVLEANERVQMKTCACDAAGAASVPSLDTSPANSCSVIESIAKEGHPDSFSPQNPYGMCAPYWKSSTPPWQTHEGMKFAQTYATSDFKPVSRREFIKQGNAILGESERQRSLARAAEIRSEAAKQCCGSDEVCANAMNAVQIKFCESKSDSDPDEPDGC